MTIRGPSGTFPSMKRYTRSQIAALRGKLHQAEAYLSSPENGDKAYRAELIRKVAAIKAQLGSHV